MGMRVGKVGKKKLDEKWKIYCKNILFFFDIFLVNYVIIYIINIKK